MNSEKPTSDSNKEVTTLNTDLRTEPDNIDDDDINSYKEKYGSQEPGITIIHDDEDMDISTNNQENENLKERSVTKRRFQQDFETNDIENIGSDNNRKYITKGPKKFRINFIHPKESSAKKIHALYFKQAITNNKNVEEKKKYLEAYQKELNNLTDMGVFDPKIKLARNNVKKDKIIPINTLFTRKRNGVY